jgi:hypothetical protein
MQVRKMGKCECFIHDRGYPIVANLLREKTRQSVPDVAMRRIGEDEAYLTVRDILSEASTVADGALSREHSGFYRCGYVTLGFSTCAVNGFRFTHFTEFAGLIYNTILFFTMYPCNLRFSRKSH